MYTLLLLLLSLRLMPQEIRAALEIGALRAMRRTGFLEDGTANKWNLRRVFVGYP
jgi:hypothetical protein